MRMLNDHSDNNKHRFHKGSGRPHGDAHHAGQHSHTDKSVKHATGRAFPRRTARPVALEVLNRVLKDGAYSNITLLEALRKNDLSGPDKGLATELVYGTIKSLGTLDWILEHFSNRPLEDLDPEIRNILRMGLYQIYFLDKIPESAAVNESVNLAKKYAHLGVAKFVNAVLRSSIRGKNDLEYPDETTAPAESLALKAFHPLWLVERWMHQFGLEDTTKLCAFDNAPARVSFRVNTLVMKRDELLERLHKDNVAGRASTWAEDGVVFPKSPGTFFLQPEFEHAFYMQGESAMLAAHILNPAAGSLVIDMCSAPGGKATHMAELMGNKGQVLACDIYPHKLKLIQSNAERLQLSIVKTELQDGTKARPEWAGKANYILADVPCSGLGVLSRRAELRWNRKENDLMEFPPLQKQILETAATYGAPGAKLLYSTCTLEPAENELVVNAFLKKHPEWHKATFKHPRTGEAMQELMLLPQKDEVDGFYLALLEKDK
jgi:16S rRNA (cytosine967-C5)-methyltransferase